MIIALSRHDYLLAPRSVSLPHCTVGFAATNAGPRGRRQRITPAPHCTVGFAATNAGPRGRRRRTPAPHCTVGFAATNAGPRGRRRRTPAPHCTVGFAATNAGPRGRGEERREAGDFELFAGKRHFSLSDHLCGKPTLPQISWTESKAEQGHQGPSVTLSEADHKRVHR